MHVLSENNTLLRCRKSAKCTRILLVRTQACIRIIIIFSWKKSNTVFYLVKNQTVLSLPDIARALVIRTVAPAPITIIAPRTHEASASPDELGNWKPITWGVGIRPVTVSCVVTKTVLLLSRSHSVGPVWVQPWMRDAFCKNLIISLCLPLVS